MAIPNLMATGQSGMVAAKAAISTAGHNIANANTEGYSRQRVITEAAESKGGQFGKNTIGTGTKIARVERINDEYIEKQIRNGHRDLSHFEEKDVALRQVEDIFNEMNGDGLNRLVSRFFNEFRKLSDEPESPSVRESVREATNAMTRDFHRLRNEVEEVRRHLDARIEGYTSEINALAKDLASVDEKVKIAAATGGPPNDLLDKRDQILKSLGSFVDISVFKDRMGNINIDMKSSGPLITGGTEPQQLSVERSPADGKGKPEAAFDVKTTSSAPGIITHQLKGGKLGALLEVRDKSISTILERLDDMAFGLSSAVNDVHRQGVTTEGAKNIDYFKPLERRERAAEFIGLSDEINDNINNMVTALEPDSPGDNRIAIGITQIQHQRLMNDGYATLDEWYNSIVSDVGVTSAKNKSALNQQKDIMTQLNKVREQISGVSIDEETANLLQFQHVYDASAKVIQIADDMLKTVLALKRD